MIISPLVQRFRDEFATVIDLNALRRAAAKQPHNSGARRVRRKLIGSGACFEQPVGHQIMRGHSLILQRLRQPIAGQQ